MTDAVAQPSTTETGGFRWTRIIIWIAVAAILAVIGIALANTFAGPPDSGNRAPDFTMTTYDGSETYSLDSLRGKVIVLNFWASWCAPCAEEALALEKAWQDYQDQGVQFLGVAYVDSKAQALAYLHKHAITYPNGPDLRSEISDAFAIRGVPETFVIDPNGQVTFYAPRIVTYRELVQEIEAARAAGG